MSTEEMGKLKKTFKVQIDADIIDIDEYHRIKHEREKIQFLFRTNVDSKRQIDTEFF